MKAWFILSCGTYLADNFVIHSYFPQVPEVSMIGAAMIGGVLALLMSK